MRCLWGNITVFDLHKTSWDAKHLLIASRGSLSPDMFAPHYGAALVSPWATSLYSPRPVTCDTCAVEKVAANCVMGQSGSPQKGYILCHFTVDIVRPPFAACTEMKSLSALVTVWVSIFEQMDDPTDISSEKKENSTE